MTDKQLIRKYCKERYPIGTEIHDSTRSTYCNGPYVINKRTVFEIYPWKAEDYNPVFLPEDPEDYYIELLVRNPSSDVNYELEQTNMRDIRSWLKWKADEPNRINERKRLEEEYREKRKQELMPLSKKLYKDLKEAVIYTDEYLCNRLFDLLEENGYVKKIF